MHAEPPSSARQLNCPGCGELLELPAGMIEPVAICPYCSQQFLTETGVAFDVSDDESARRAEQERRNAELDGLRMRQIATLKQSTIRARSYALIAMVLCASGAIKLIILGISGGWSLRSAIEFLGAIVLALTTVHFSRRVSRLHRESRESALPEPAQPPDFSTLDNGSQRVRNLEKLG